MSCKIVCLSCSPVCYLLPIGCLVIIILMSWEASLTRTIPKIIGVGKNYLKHVIEMGGKDIPKEPVIFMKPWSSIAYAPKQLKLSNPSHEHEIHHEIELGVLIGKSGYQVKKSQAQEYIGGYFLLLDMTDRGTAVAN